MIKRKKKKYKCRDFLIAYDIWMNRVVFSDMKLGGIIFIFAGFFMVLTPANWDVILKQIIR